MFQNLRSNTTFFYPLFINGVPINPLKICSKYWMIFTKTVLNSIISLYPCHLKKKLEFYSYSKKVTGPKFSQKCLSEKAPDSNF